MVPLIVLVVASAVFWFAGRLGVTIFQQTSTVLRTALGLMFFSYSIRALGQETARSDPDGTADFSPA